MLLGVDLKDTLVICDDPLGKRLAKKKAVPRLSTVQLAAEMVVGGALSHAAGVAVFNASAGGADPRHFNNAVRQAREVRGSKMPVRRVRLGGSAS